MAAYIRLDLAARPAEPRPQPHDAIAFDLCRHAGEPGWPGAAQGLQQHRLGLVAAVVSEQHSARARFKRRCPQCPIALASRPGLDAVAASGPIVQPPRDQSDRQTAPCPSLTLRLAVGEPVVGIRAQPVVDVQRDDIDTDRRGLHQRRMQQRGRITPAAVGDRDAAPRHGHDRLRSAAADQCSLVSLKRPYDCSRS